MPIPKIAKRLQTPFEVYYKAWKPGGVGKNKKFETNRDRSDASPYDKVTIVAATPARLYEANGRGHDIDKVFDSAGRKLQIDYDKLVFADVIRSSNASAGIFRKQPMSRQRLAELRRLAASSDDAETAANARQHMSDLDWWEQYGQQ